MKRLSYMTYKNSNVEWLGDIPEHWNVMRIRHLFEIRKRISGELGYDVLSITQKGIKVKDTESGEGQLSMDYSKYQFVEEGDFAMNHMDLLTGYVDISKHNGVTSPDYRVFTIKDKSRCHDQYFLYLMQMGYNNKIFFAYGQGSSQLGRWRFPTEQFNDFHFPAPTLKEQQAIANFLDTKAALIDDLIAKKERQIELMKEKRTALINKAVTKGLNPDVPMKDSGIEWLGEVPEHWDVKRLRFVVDMNPSKSETRVLDKNTLVSFLPMESIGTDGSLKLVQEKAICEVDTGYTFVREGDVTIAKITPCFENGKGAVMRGLLNGYGFGTTELIVARPKEEKTISEYLHLLFTSSPFRKYGESHMYGAGGQKRVPDDFVRNFTIAFPPISEQNTIVNFLANETEKIDCVIEFIKQHITKLSEYRLTLITAAVTGKIDVREAVSAS